MCLKIFCLGCWLWLAISESNVNICRHYSSRNEAQISLWLPSEAIVLLSSGKEFPVSGFTLARTYVIWTRLCELKMDLCKDME